MSVLTPLDVPDRFVDGYLAAAIETASPVSLQFDPSSFGVEQPLTGPLLYRAPEDSVCGGPRLGVMSPSKSTPTMSWRWRASNKRS